MYVTDIHCHILHGVDDGAQTMEDSLDIIGAQYSAGVRNIVITPHYRPRMFETPRSVIADRFEELKQKVSEEYPDISLFLGSEYFVNSDIINDITKQPQFRINEGKYILIEFGENVSTSTIKNAVYDLRSHGFFPIIAHIERCMNIVAEKDYKTIDIIRDFNALVQVNAGSVIGLEGKHRQKFVKNLIEDSICDVIASDAHDTKKRGVCLKEAADYIEKRYGTKTKDRLLSEIPGSIIEK